MNEHDSEHMAGLLGSKGLIGVDSPEEADVIVVNTCCIRENADNKLYGHLGYLKTIKDERPATKIVVSGCLAQKDGEYVRERAPYVDVVVGTHNLHRVPELLDESRENGPVTEVWTTPEAESVHFSSDLPPMNQDGASAWITIQQGCNNSCGFCIVPTVRGPEVSRAFDDIIKEIENYAKKGVREVTLLGQNVNSYGRDLALKARENQDFSLSSEEKSLKPWFAKLLIATGNVRGIDRVRFISPHPKDIRPETIAAMADTKEVCESLHLPVQSGSDEVLSAMRRGYTAERYLEKVNAAKAAIIDLALSTDIIIGYPGESENDFAKTLDLVSEVEYDSVYTFIFSPRPGTRAALMEDRFISDEVIAERMARLRVVVEHSALKKHQERIGMIEELLIVGPSKRNTEVISGRTRQGKLVHLPDPGQELRGALVSALIVGASTHYLKGEMREIISPPQSKTFGKKIPIKASVTVG
ncbi:MAG: tRNA (N6-isopentenyl adenosine(37)-C2)-methylthiotransferase MiaB [Acidimicrobiales bacterium]|nr:tRNA (N6-isopentenyl adenosine(37)-C2)-methylthiotransferase MiaB [Acidimicrobiales bacterium]